MDNVEVELGNLEYELTKAIKKLDRVEQRAELFGRSETLLADAQQRPT